MAVDWSLLRTPDIIGNALNAFEQGKTARREEASRNALATLVQNPNDTAAMGQLAQADPGVAMQYQGHQAQIAKQRQEQQQQQVQMLGRLLNHATDETTYQQSLAAARQAGVDVSSAPPAFDPNWVNQQRLVLEAFSDPEKLTALMQNIQGATGYRPGTPEFQEAMRKEMEAAHSKTIPFVPGGGVLSYNSATGAMRPLVVPNSGGYSAGTPVQQQAAQIPPKPAGMTDEQIWAQAHEAVRNGANADDVFRRLQAWGMKP